MTNRKKPIRFGVLGTGWVAQRFMADLAHVDGAELFAIGSRGEARAKEIGRRFGAKRSHGAYAGLLADEAVDVVYVASEHPEHVEHCLVALGNDKAVLCEKPFTMNANEAEKVIGLARERRRFCMEAMWTRFLPGTLSLERYIANGKIGVPKLVSADFGTPVVGGDDNRFFSLARGGGALLDRGVYPIALAVRLFGAPVRVRAVATKSPSGVDETVGVLLEFRDGQLASLSASLSALSGNEATIAGTLGRLRIHEPMCRPERFSFTPASPMAADRREDLVPGSLRDRTRRLASSLRGRLPRLPGPGRQWTVPAVGHGYGHQASEVVRCLRQGLSESPLLPLHETLTVMRVLDQVRAEVDRVTSGGS